MLAPLKDFYKEAFLCQSFFKFEQMISRFVTRKGIEYLDEVL